ncbi:hypothetical protein RIR_jg39461.t2 [Rhizophagus irregularis DAOM 181602=DAOM 197198]|nr:hypothetical protein RIR_jg39461.t2 [Rhizophagus irregularis DAOM 181602=DAOM 197198]
MFGNRTESGSVRFSDNVICTCLAVKEDLKNNKVEVVWSIFRILQFGITYVTCSLHLQRLFDMANAAGRVFVHRLLGLFDSSRCFKAKNLSLIKSRRYLKYFVTVADENCLFKENTKLRSWFQQFVLKTKKGENICLFRDRISISNIFIVGISSETSSPSVTKFSRLACIASDSLSKPILHQKETLVLCIENRTKFRVFITGD